MSTKLFLGIMLVVLAIAGYVIYRNYADRDSMTGTGISFICSDQTYFMADFSADFSELEVVVDGETVRTVPRVSGEALYEYEDDGFRYVFAGEDARIINLADNAEVTCSQPMDPNNAPYNFGDAGEGEVRPDVARVVRESIQGEWQSVDDSSFTREFRADSTLIDSYVGSESTEGLWEVFTSDSGLETPFEMQPGTVYLRITSNEGASEMLFFSINKLSPEELELTYLDRGGVLRFTYVGPAGTTTPAE